MKDIITVGDTVDVHFTSSASMYDYVVTYHPSSPGDLWILKGEEGDIVYVQVFERMDKKEKSKS